MLYVSDVSQCRALLNNLCVWYRPFSWRQLGEWTANQFTVSLAGLILYGVYSDFPPGECWLHARSVALCSELASIWKLIQQTVFAFNNGRWLQYEMWLTELYAISIWHWSQGECCVRDLVVCVYMLIGLIVAALLNGHKASSLKITFGWMNSLRVYFGTCFSCLNKPSVLLLRGLASMLKLIEWIACLFNTELACMWSFIVFVRVTCLNV